MRRVFILAAFVLMTSCLLRAEPQAAVAKGDIPTIPALVVGGAETERFVVEGVLRSSRRRGLGFRVAADGRSQACAVYDISDGTPLFLSDGSQTLVYDLPTNQVILVPNSRATVRVDWLANAEKPLAINLDVRVETNPAKLEQANSFFRIDRFVAAVRDKLQRLETKDGTTLYAADRGTAVEALQTAPAKDDWFRFTSSSKEDGFYRLELDARHVGKPVPQIALAFPDVERLGRDVPIKTATAGALPAALALGGGTATIGLKLALIEDPDAGPSSIPPAALEQYRRRDAQLGQTYRAALAKQGLRFPTQAPLAPKDTPEPGGKGQQD